MVQNASNIAGPLLTVPFVILVDQAPFEIPVVQVDQNKTIKFKRFLSILTLVFDQSDYWITLNHIPVIIGKMWQA